MEMENPSLAWPENKQRRSGVFELNIMTDTINN